MDIFRKFKKMFEAFENLRLFNRKSIGKLEIKHIRTNYRLQKFTNLANFRSFTATI